MPRAGTEGLSCIFSSNGAGRGAIYNEGTAQVNNSSFLGNVADTGAGIRTPHHDGERQQLLGNVSFSTDVNSGDAAVFSTAARQR